MRFTVTDDAGMELCCRIFAAYAGDGGAPWATVGMWAFLPRDEETLVMYPHPRQRIKPRHAHRLTATVTALIRAGYGGGTAETVRLTEHVYPDGERGAAIAVRPEIPDSEVERYKEFYLRKYGRPAA